MRKRGASPVAVVALVVVIVACVGFVVYYLSRGGGPPVTGSTANVEKKYMCAACGYTEVMTLEKAGKLEEGGAFDGGSAELRKCPECGKFAFDSVSTCPKCEKEYVDTGKGCPTCGKPKPKDE